VFYGAKRSKGNPQSIISLENLSNIALNFIGFYKSINRIASIYYFVQFYPSLFL